MSKTLREAAEALGSEFQAGDAESDARPQERRNVERLQRMIRTIAEGRFDELRDQLDPDVEFEIVAPDEVPWVRHARGADEVAAVIEANFGSVDRQQPEPLALVAQGDTVMVMSRETGHWRESGRPYRVLNAQQFTFRDGRLAGYRSVAGLVDEQAS
ncbi:MAG TPA: nuclear transport factor 2 family protein [Longimicrobium sp.]|nr:nuclear transport factor 2 family protein [Longimicrobium sp.]